ncbi:MAG: GntR family transcriptional regulator [Oscillospiraceae bacterium]|nr:GntR family transcriptional regulator [Oscillospiraceae bacterium]
MAWIFSSDRPIYLQLTDRVISGILTGEYPMGSKLPSVREFAEIASVNPNTVQRALAELEAVGLIDNQRTTGKFVTEEEERITMAREKRGSALARDFLKNMTDLGYDSDQVSQLLREAQEEKEEDEDGYAGY